MRFGQGRTGHLARHFEQLVDIATRTDEVNFVQIRGMFFDPLLGPVPFAGRNFVFQGTHGAQFEGLRAFFPAFFDDRKFGAATAHVHIKVVFVRVDQVFQVGVGNKLRFAGAVDNFDADTRFLADAVDDLLAVAGFAHGRSGHSQIILHVEHIHEQFKGLHGFDEFFLLGRRNFAAFEHIFAQTDRHAHQGVFLYFTSLVSVAHHIGNKQTYGIGADVDGGEFDDFHNRVFQAKDKQIWAESVQRYSSGLKILRSAAFFSAMIFFSISREQLPSYSSLVRPQN